MRGGEEKGTGDPRRSDLKSSLFPGGGDGVNAGDSKGVCCTEEPGDELGCVDAVEECEG